MDGSWSHDIEEDRTDNPTEASTGSWSYDVNKSASDREAKAKRLKQHLDHDGHDPRLRSQRFIAGQSLINQTEHYETVSQWWKQATIVLLISPLVFMFSLTIALVFGQSNSTLAFLFILVALILYLGVRLALPYSIYKDINIIQNSIPEWNPRKRWYIIGTLLVPPPLEYFTAIFYLHRRYLYLGKPNFAFGIEWLKRKWYSYRASHK